MTESESHEVETINKLFLELSQFATAETAKELQLRRVIGMLNSMIESGEQHSPVSRQAMREAMDK